jgi:hypothetical protein
MIITTDDKNWIEVYNYIEQHPGTTNDKFIVTGVDMFDYTDYPVAICDTKDELDHIVEQRRRAMQPGGMPDATWVQYPYARERRRLL